jgi:predicted ATPase
MRAEVRAMGEKSIEKLTIKGFKSIKNLDRFPLKNLNVLIGPNGSGKSNFISYFSMVKELLNGRLQLWTSKQGNADRVVSLGVEETDSIESAVMFSFGSYKFRLEVTAGHGFSFTEEHVSSAKGQMDNHLLLGIGHDESILKKSISEKKEKQIIQPFWDAISGWMIFHFHNTSDRALIKRDGNPYDNDYLRSDGENLAAFLYMLCRKEPDLYSQICETIRLAIPFFDDFVLKPQELRNGESTIKLFWRQKGSDYILWPHQLSDGAIRFICLTTALLQPNPPSTIIIDEPEIGLHPYAITLLAALLQSASARMQVIVSTQSVDLVNEFSIDDLVIAEREDGATIFRREEERNFDMWLDQYSVGELWERNILGGRPSR